jgi:uncharacterized membrane protein
MVTGVSVREAERLRKVRLVTRLSVVTVVVSLTVVTKITTATIGLLVTIVNVVTSATILVINVRNCSGKVSYFCAIKTEFNLSTNFSKNHPI